MSSFGITHLRWSTFDLYVAREQIWFDPPYQREAGIWPVDKRQLLIDSILNGFDIPKIYLHHTYAGFEVDGMRYRHAIIDGKQRLSAIWDFVDGHFPLGRDASLLGDSESQLEGLTYEGLSFLYPEVKARFDAQELDVVEVTTDDTELIEEMFSRLNEAVPLSAAAKRNALRGPLPPIIRRLARHPFFERALPFSNRRYRHFDLAAKFLYMVHRSELPDLKKAYLDEFVISFREHGTQQAARALLERSEEVLGSMNGVFEEHDPLLRQVGMATLYFKLFDDIGPVPREQLLAFEHVREENRIAAAEDVAEADYPLLEFDRLAQSPNDQMALRFRYEVVLLFAGEAPGRA